MNEIGGSEIFSRASILTVGLLSITLALFLRAENKTRDRNSCVDAVFNPICRHHCTALTRDSPRTPVVSDTGLDPNKESGLLRTKIKAVPSAGDKMHTTCKEVL